MSVGGGSSSTGAVCAVSVTGSPGFASAGPWVNQPLIWSVIWSGTVMTFHSPAASVMRIEMSTCASTKAARSVQVLTTSGEDPVLVS